MDIVDSTFINVTGTKDDSGDGDDDDDDIENDLFDCSRGAKYTGAPRTGGIFVWSFDWTSGDGDNERKDGDGFGILAKWLDCTFGNTGDDEDGNWFTKVTGFNLLFNNFLSFDNDARTICKICIFTSANISTDWILSNSEHR